MKDKRKSIEMSSICRSSRREIRGLLLEHYRPTGENRVDTSIPASMLSAELVADIESVVYLTALSDVVVTSITIVSYNALSGTKTNRFFVDFTASAS